MNDKNSKGYGFPAQLGMLIGLIGGGIIAGMIVSVIIWKVMTGRPLLSMETDLVKPEYYYAVMVIQAVSTFFVFFLPAWLVARICYRQPNKFMGFHRHISYKQVAIMLGILLLTFPLSGTLAEFTKWIPIPKSWEIKFTQMEDSRAAQEAALIHINSFPKYLLSMLIIAFLPALFEEACFRGGIQNILTRWFKSPWAAILVTGAIFSAVHISYYGFFVRFGLGIILGLIFYYSASLWLSVLFHFLYNGIQVTALYMTAGQPQPAKDIEKNFPVWVGVIALGLIIFAFIKFREASAAQQQKFVYEEPEDPQDHHNWIAKP